jgi:phosphoribosylanthranilate isomerase
MTLFVKICGLTTDEAVAAAVEAGADALGFVFSAASPRNLSVDQALRLAANAPTGVRKVAVTRRPSQTLVGEILAAFAPDVWQSDAEDFRMLRLPDTVKRWPVLRSGGALPDVPPRRFVYEGLDSGAGSAADWAEAAELARRGELILAGGLHAGNVADAVVRVRPFGVDVSSGVESAPGRKDPAKIAVFIAAARRAAGEIDAD